MNKITAAITGVQGYVPEHVLSNEDLTKIVDTSDEWITTRTGIKERRIMKNGASSDMAAEAVKSLLKKKNIDPLEIELVVLASVTPDHLFPSTANILCDKVGMTNAWGFDLLAACSGFLFALTTASQFIENGRYKKVLVVGVDKMSSIVDYTDRTTCIIFGDGAGAVILEKSEKGWIYSELQANGSGTGMTGFKQPLNEPFIMNAKEVWQQAVSVLPDSINQVLLNTNTSIDEISMLVPHQPSINILKTIANDINLPMTK